MPVCPCLAVADIFAAWCLRTQGKVRMAVIYEPGTSALPAEAAAAARAAPACSCSPRRPPTLTAKSLGQSMAALVSLWQLAVALAAPEALRRS
jgi:hypothetical protein